jgi:hypothetical protein
MSIVINGKKKNGILWNILAALIVIPTIGGTFLLIGSIFMGILMLFTSPIWLPIVLVLLLR